MSDKTPETYAQFGKEAGDIMWQMHQRCVRLEAENERLRKDAERYRWLRHYRVTITDVDGNGYRVFIVDDEEFEEFDAAIDEAIKNE